MTQHCRTRSNTTWHIIAQHMSMDSLLSSAWTRRDEPLSNRLRISYKSGWMLCIPPAKLLVVHLHSSNARSPIGRATCLAAQVHDSIGNTSLAPTTREEAFFPATAAPNFNNETCSHSVSKFRSTAWLHTSETPQQRKELILGRIWTRQEGSTMHLQKLLFVCSSEWNEGG